MKIKLKFHISGGRLFISLIFLLICFSSRAQSIIELPKTEILGREYYIYEAKKGETAYGIAKKYGWDLNEFLEINKESSGILQKGKKLYYPLNNTIKSNKTENYSLTKDNTDIFIHKVNKGETIYSISKLYNVPLDVLYSLNPKAKKGIKTGENIYIPKDNEALPAADLSTGYEISSNKTTKHLTDIEDDNLNSGYENKYPSLVEESDEEEIIEYEFDGVRIALIMDEPTSNKDLDFTRGLLVKLSELENSPYSINLKVMDGGMSHDFLTEELDNFEANLIISTADKTFPLFLVDYGNTNDIPVINVFDLKNDLYQDNPSLIQILPPSNIFYENLANKIYKDNSRRKLLTIGEKDDNDGLSQVLADLYNENAEHLSLEEFGALEPDIMEPVLLYPYASKKEDIYDFFNNVEHLAESFPGYDFKIIGRSNWIAMTDEFADKFDTYTVEIPSRVWIDEEAPDWKNFTDKYEEMFNGYPVRSIPNYAASGYDIADYFVQQIGDNEGNIKISNRMAEGLQNNFRFKKQQNGGLLNDIVYLIKFNLTGKKEKIIAK